MKSMDEIIKEQIRENIRIQNEMLQSSSAVIKQAVELIIETLRSGNKILICGNGGSAADSQHIAAEIVGRFRINRNALPAVALTTDTSILTAVANDFGYKEVFRRQVEALGRRGDLLIGISTSGGSENIVLAMETARTIGMKTVAFTGAKKGPMTGNADVWIMIPSLHTARIQEGHITTAHIICDLVETILFS